MKVSPRRVSTGGDDLRVEEGQLLAVLGLVPDEALLHVESAGLE